LLLHNKSKASGSIGRAAVSKTAGWGFESLLACHFLAGNLFIDRILGGCMASSKEVKRKAQEPERKGDGIKWALVWFLIGCAIFANWYFDSISEAIKIAVGIVFFVFVLLAVGWTQKGLIAWGFIKGANQELRRVHWQTRSEVLNVSFRVMLVVAVVTVLLWLFDSFFMWAIGLISR
jgi:preprotein translocase subunit SecE